MTKIGILIPTRGDRKMFLNFALRQIQKQTLQASEIEIVNDTPISDQPDITWRYRIGCERLVAKGCEFIVFWEDDDWYSSKYIETMHEKWQANGQPDLIGLNHTIYYNIFTQQYMKWTHRHASMFSTCISAKGVKATKWGDDNYSFTDIVLWRQLKGFLFVASPDISCGIKHGIGLCGGGGHREKFDHYQKSDVNHAYLSTVVDSEALAFYKSLILKQKYSFSKYKLSKEPFLTIVTRTMKDKRPTLLAQHKESVRSLQGLDLQQIFIVDEHKLGMLNANTSFIYVTEFIEGEYIHLLDDDDFYTNPNFINLLKDNAHTFPDVILFKMKILTGDGDEMYPKPESWETRNVKRGQIGGSCFVVRKWVYEKYIHEFARPSLGDWHFISTVLKDPAVTVKYIDEKMCETGKVSRGAEE